MKKQVSEAGITRTDGDGGENLKTSKEEGVVLRDVKEKKEANQRQAEPFDF